MAGLTDWLNDILGGSGSTLPASQTSPPPASPPLTFQRPEFAAGQPGAPMPPVQQTGADAPPLPSPPGLGLDQQAMASGNPAASLPPAAASPQTAGLPPPPGPLPAGEPVPFPNAGQLTPPPPPPAATPPAASPSLPPQAGGGAVAAPPAPTMPAPDSQPGAPPVAGGSYLSNIFGDPNRRQSFMAALGKGLAAVPANSHGPGLAAVAGTAGAGILGGVENDHKVTEEQQKYLTNAIAAKKAGDDATYHVNYMKYLNTKAEADTKASKASVMNTQQQLYLRGLTAVSQDPEIKASAASLKAIQTQNEPNSPAVLQAIKAHQDLIDQKKKQVMATLGVDEKTAASIEKRPGMSQETAIKPTTQAEIDGAAPGTWIQTPAGPKMKPLNAPAAVPAAAPGAPGSPAPATPPATAAAAMPTDEPAESND